MRQLLIALVKDARTDVVSSCNEEAAKMVGKPLGQIVGHRSSEIWPDNGTTYRRDDLEVASTQKPKLDISEWVIINGRKVDVVTDKYPAGESLVQVLVWVDNDANFASESFLEYGGRYSVAVIERKPSWVPTSALDIPEGFSTNDIKFYDVVPQTGEVLMTLAEARKILESKNAEALKNTLQTTWRVVVAPGVH
jgi:hypothetical protein